MKSIKRRDFIKTGARTAAGVAVAVPVAARSGKRIKAGQIGVGHAHAAGKVGTMRKLNEDYQVVGVVEPDPRLRRQWENHPAYRDLKWMTEEQLLSTPALEAVAVETAVRDLVPTAARCVAAGKHIHLDKPAGPSLAAFKTVLDEAHRNGLTVQMGYMFRNNSAFRFCFNAVRQGWLGEIFELDAVISKAISDARRPPLAEYSGGSMFELGCHLVDAAVAVLGKPQKVTPHLRRTRHGRDNLADNTLAVLENPQGHLHDPQRLDRGGRESPAAVRRLRHSVPRCRRHCGHDRYPSPGAAQAADGPGPSPRKVQTRLPGSETAADARPPSVPTADWRSVGRACQDHTR